jgi:signal transduction histidine kinase
MRNGPLSFSADGMQPISDLGIHELRMGGWESEIATQSRDFLFAFLNRVPRNGISPVPSLFRWFAEMMCSAARKIGEIGGAVAHHLPMMCRTDGENGFRARVSASNAIHPAMMCSSGGEKPQNRPAHCTPSVDGVHGMRRKAPKRQGSCTSLSRVPTSGDALARSEMSRRARSLFIPVQFGHRYWPGRPAAIFTQRATIMKVMKSLYVLRADPAAAVTARSGPIVSRWELAAETIAVKIRWFGLLFGYVLVNVGDQGIGHRTVLNAILSLGVMYAVLDTAYSVRGRVFLGRWPLLVSLMEALFIGLLCYFHSGLESAFRYYYFLSLICCAIRHSARVTYTTWALHSASYGLLYLSLPLEQQQLLVLLLTLVVLAWVTWASAAMSLLLKQVGDHLGRLNRALEANQAELEARIAERTRELQEAQAHVLHQEKMAAFGLLAAGIAHEVGNPLTSISSLVQMLQRRDQDAYTKDKLALVSGQLQRIQNTLRELVNFSRPASSVHGLVSLTDILSEALNIAKYYKRTKGRRIDMNVPADLPHFNGCRDELVQVFLNLVLNGVDATEQGGRIEIAAEHEGPSLVVSIRDDGHGIAPEDAGRLFQPYFTTKNHGTGLGLFVTRKLVADHGGSVEFSSTPGQGTVFRVRLPAPLADGHVLSTAATAGQCV